MKELVNHGYDFEMVPTAKFVTHRVLLVLQTP